MNAFVPCDTTRINVTGFARLQKLVGRSIQKRSDVAGCGARRFKRLFGECFGGGTVGGTVGGKLFFT